MTRSLYIERLARTGRGWWSATPEERIEAAVERCLMSERGEQLAALPPSPAELAILNASDNTPKPADEGAGEEEPPPKLRCARCGENTQISDGGLMAISCGCWRRQR